MARIRTIKPEFFSNEQLAQCSPYARLLAIALLQLSDSAGRLRWIPMQVHAHAFPFEEKLDVDRLAQELEAIGYLVRYESESRLYAEVVNFVKHQRLTGKEAEQESKIPPREATGKDMGNTEVFPEKHPDAQEREREQGIDMSDSGKPESCPHEQIINLYHEKLPELQRVVTSRWKGSKREKTLQSRWRESEKHHDMKFWDWFFSTVRTNPHWMGENGSGWRADLGWLLERRNFDKVIERGASN